MPITRDEAVSALKDIARTERHSLSLRSYREAAPHLILWGCIWVIGYGGSYAPLPHAALLWPALTLAGIAGSTMIGRRSHASGRRTFDWRIFCTWLACAGAIASIIAIFAPVNGMQIGTLFPLIVGWAYVILGVWVGTRMVLAGVAIVALTLLGFFTLAPALFMLWMAILGGAVLIGSGLWLRSA